MGSLPNLHALSSADSVLSLSLQPPYMPPRFTPHRLSAGHRPAPPPLNLQGCVQMSPAISTRSAHCSLHSRCGRRDSLASSAGGTSVRRLIALVRATPSQFGPAFSERALARNHAALCLGHATFAAALVPLLALQTSSFRSELTGPLLLSLSLLCAAVTSLATPLITLKVPPHVTLVVSYLLLSVFFGLHLYTSPYTFVPGYVLFGITLGPLCHVQVTLLVNLAAKLAFVSEEPRVLVQARLARQFYLAHCLGHAIGSAVTGLVLWYTVLELDIEFDYDTDGKRVCGSLSCPIITSLNTTAEHFELSLPCKAATMLYSIYVGCCVMAVALSATFLDKMPVMMREGYVERTLRGMLCSVVKSFKDSRLRCLTPLFLFIGFEQAFILIDYSKWYVVCGLGVSHVALALVGMGALQAVAGCTLSLLMQHVPRGLVSVVGLVFHACLVLALAAWHPSRDDAALFYVICAAWGVCNAIWETLAFALLSALYCPDTWQPPLSHSLLWRHLGALLACIVHPLLCVRSKLLVLSALLASAVAALALLERSLFRHRRPSHRRSGSCSGACKLQHQSS